MAKDSTTGATAQTRWTEKRARAALDAWRRSGQSGAAFARAIGVVPQRLYWWKRRLSRDAAVPAFVPVVAVAPRSTSSTRVVAGPPLASAISATASAALVVSSTGGVRIEVYEVDASTAAWVTSVLDGGTGR